MGEDIAAAAPRRGVLTLLAFAGNGAMWAALGIVGWWVIRR